VIGSPHHYPGSRPTSPRPSRHASEEPSSPTRERSTVSASSMLGEGVSSTGMGRSASQVDLSHIFERGEYSPFLESFSYPHLSFLRKHLKSSFC
jgi:hypothetical protein